MIRSVHIEVRGTVQGVGFRPFVYRLAQELGVTGDVCNAGGTVSIHAWAPPPVLEKFAALLAERAPRHARVDAVRVGMLGTGEPPAAFTVAASTVVAGAGEALPPDLATCPACLAELFDPADRRFRYPFVTCTDCGPRASIVAALPYDRDRTSMRGFPMCARCAAEYRDPANRRFHAEPIACPDCGPQLAWWPAGAGGPAPAVGGEEALRQAVRVVRAGGVVAVKGIGGYQLVCDAAREPAVARLRAAKHRPTKPFAVMVRDRAAAAQLSTVDSVAAGPLGSAAAPVVLLPRRAGGGLAPSVAPGVADLGLFLPCGPVHHLLLAELARPLVVTSGNRGDEPIAIDDAAAREVLGPMTDGLLGHDRPIWSRYDDSVVRVVAGAPTLVRRARGYAPDPLPLPVPAAVPLLALGAQLKHTVTLAVGRRAYLGPHTGDLSDTTVFAAFEQIAARLCRLHAVIPVDCAHDRHPGYLSSQHARRWPDGHRIAVQHHHAHVAATAAEHGVRGPFLGVAYDGLGLGDDGTLWGGELLLADYTGYRRLARFATAPLPGGEAAVRHPARMALGYLYGAEDLDDGGPAELAELAGPIEARIGAATAGTVRGMIRAGVNCPRASSAGRLFDAAAALLEVCDDASYEGEAAVRLEAVAADEPDGEPLAWRLHRRGGLWVYDPRPTLLALPGTAARDGLATAAARFHTTLAAVTAELVGLASIETGVRTVCLGGGVFVNRRLTGGVVARLRATGHTVHTAERVPTNDGGISYGQAVVAAARLAGQLDQRDQPAERGRG